MSIIGNGKKSSSRMSMIIYQFYITAVMQKKIAIQADGDILLLLAK